MEPTLFNRNIDYDQQNSLFDDHPAVNEFYESDYLSNNPDMHLDDVAAKTDFAIKIIDELKNTHHYLPTKILDVGSGSTLILQGALDYIRKFTAQTPIGVAVDLSKAILLKSKPQPNIYKLRADASDLPIADKSFDLIYMFDLIEHTVDPKKVIAEAARVARYVAIKTPLELAFYTKLHGGQKRLSELEKKYGHIQHFNREAVVSLLGPSTRIISEYYEKIPRRSPVIDVMQSVLLKCKLYSLYRNFFGGFIVLVIET